MSRVIVVHDRKQLSGVRGKTSGDAQIRVDINDLTPEEIVNVVLDYEGVADVWIRTAKLLSVSAGRWLRFDSNLEKEYRLKRALDVVWGGILLTVSIPLFAVASLLVRLSSGRGVLFRQPRVDSNLRTFNLYKFRTMNHSPYHEQTHEDYMRRSITNPNPDRKVHKLVDDPRITRIGKWIRRLSIDELPQLMNVLKGEMSLVGPRPPIPYEVKEYAGWHYARFRAKPGLTGMWQVKGRSLIPFEEMVVLDLYYAYNQSMWLDLKLLFQTVPRVLSLKGAF
jgi:lipopolysaccharide/colanic/teichoic acid biosynthesis glycosyltransferase